ncbi:phage Gp37/Gp68 family protein [Nonomuraea sp. NPDC055795]
MSDRSAIEWTDATWNPVTGCTKVSPGCDHCYAETFAGRWRGTPGHPFEQGFNIRLWPERLDLPLRWRKPRKIFVTSMGDLFHEQVPDEFIVEVFARMWWSPQHTFQVLTKRHSRLRSLLPRIEAPLRQMETDLALADCPTPLAWPLPNVLLGVSVEDQRRANLRIPTLLQTPATRRFLSCEPLLGPVDLSPWLGLEWMESFEGWGQEMFASLSGRVGIAGGLHWIIAGGESGPGARPMHPDWARTLRDQCQAAGVPFLFKQWGEYLSVPVEDDPAFFGGRAFDHPRGGRSAPVLRERGRSGTFRAGVTRLMLPGEATRGGVLLDPDTIAIRVGKKRAGRQLDGRTWEEFPTTTTMGTP